MHHRPALFQAFGHRPMIHTGFAVAALLATALPAAAQGTLNGATLFRSNAAGNANLVSGQVRAAWRTSDGASGQTLAEFYLRNRANADNSGTFYGNTAPNFLQIPLSPGANTFWFYANGDDPANPGTSFGLNLSFGTGPVSASAAPAISAVTSLGGGFSVIGSGQSTVYGNSTFGAAAGTLSVTQGGWVYTLSNYQLLADQRVGSTIDRVGYFDPLADSITDNYGTFTLTVTAVPEPGSWVLLAGGLLALGGMARRRLPAC